MSTDSQRRVADQQKGHSHFGIRGILTWSVVLVPLFWGATNTLRNAVQLFGV